MVGELHSLTDWQVSDASEDAELDDFCERDNERETLKGSLSKFEFFGYVVVYCYAHFIYKQIKDILNL